MIVYWGLHKYVIIMGHVWIHKRLEHIHLWITITYVLLEGSKADKILLSEVMIRKKGRQIVIGIHLCLMHRKVCALWYTYHDISTYWMMNKMIYFHFCVEADWLLSCIKEYILPQSILLDNFENDILVMSIWLLLNQKL